MSKSLRDVHLSLGLALAHKSTVLLEGPSKGVDVGRFRRTPERAEGARELCGKLGIPVGAAVAGFVGRVTLRQGGGRSRCGLLAPRGGLPEVHLLLVGSVEADDSPSPQTLAAIEGHHRHTPDGHAAGGRRRLAAHGPPGPPLLPGVPSERRPGGSAAGRPTIGFRSTGVVDSIVDGATGRLVARGNVDDLAAAMRAYLADPATAEAHGAAALERVERLFAQEGVFGAVAGFYRYGLGAVAEPRGVPTGMAG